MKSDLIMRTLHKDLDYKGYSHFNDKLNRRLSDGFFITDTVTNLVFSYNWSIKVPLTDEKRTS